MLNWIRNYLKQRRERLQEELTNVQQRLESISAETAMAKELNLRIHEGAVDRGSTHEKQRQASRNRGVLHNLAIIDSLRRQERRLKRKLGIVQ